MAKKDVSFSGQYSTSKGNILTKLSVIIFEDTQSIVAYCPALNVYGYGKDELEAKNSFEVSLGEFFRYTVNKGTLHQELIKLGWTIKSAKKFNPPDFRYLLDHNQDFNDIFNNREFKKVDQNIEIPSAA